MGLDKKSLDEVVKESDNWAFLAKMMKEGIFTLGKIDSDVVMKFDTPEDALEIFDFLAEHLNG